MGWRKDMDKSLDEMEALIFRPDSPLSKTDQESIWADHQRRMGMVRDRQESAEGLGFGIFILLVAVVAMAILASGSQQ